MMVCFDSLFLEIAVVVDRIMVAARQKGKRRCNQGVRRGNNKKEKAQK
jgi:hypothetical protein